MMASVFEVVSVPFSSSRSPLTSPSWLFVFLCPCFYISFILSSCLCLSFSTPLILHNFILNIPLSPLLSSSYTPSHPPVCLSCAHLSLSFTHSFYSLSLSFSSYLMCLFFPQVVCALHNLWRSPENLGLESSTRSSYGFLRLLMLVPLLCSQMRMTSGTRLSYPHPYCISGVNY